MAYGEFYVEQQGWAHWPKVLMMCRKRGDGIERRRYVPERTCHVVSFPMGLSEDDGDVDLCSECRVPIDPDVYFCSNCGARLEDK